jgi:hypothetical protein
MHEYDEENDRSALELRALLDALAPADLARNLGGGWNVAAALAHLAFWDRRAAAVCALWTQGRTTAPSSDEDCADEATNAALDALLAALPPQLVAPLASEAAAAANAAFAALTPELAVRALAPDSPIVAHRSRHRREHIAQIRAALDA